MSLQDTIKDLEEKLSAAALEEERNKEQESELEEKIEDIATAEEEQTEDTAEEKPEEAKAAEADTEPMDNAAWAKMRREAAAAKRKAEESEAKRLQLEVELEELRASKSAAQTAETSAQVDLPPEVEEIIHSQRMAKAAVEFNALEDKFRSSTPGYDAVAYEYAMALAQAIKIQNRGLTDAQIANKTKETILLKAANFLNSGYDPIEELYHEAKELGFTGKTALQAKTQKEEKPLGPDMKKLAANRERSSGMAATGGKGNSTNLTPTSALSMSVQEFAKLSPDQQNLLIRQTQGL